MRISTLNTLILLGALLIFTQCATTVRYNSIQEWGKANSEIASFVEIADDKGFDRYLILWIDQLLDHNNPTKGTFKQRVWLSHRSVDAPVILVTEGYWAQQSYASELATMLEANQIVVEHRFYGASIPENTPWEYLTVEQTIRDHEAIIKLFKPLYSGKWISTGVSKGGQMALNHRAMFPKSVELTVAYVAPFNLEREDQRLYDFFETIGTEELRKATFEFQKEVLKRRDNMIPLLKDLAERNRLTFKMSIEEVLELAVLEYPFSAWQWCADISDMPDLSSADDLEVFNHFHQGIDIRYFSQQEGVRLGTFFYQAYKELGFYGYVTGELKPYLKAFKTDTVSSDIFIPDECGEVAFNAETSAKILKRFRKIDPATVHIVGANDPWSATSINVDGLKNSLKVVDPNGCHLTRINTLPAPLQKEVKDFIYMKLRSK